MGPSGAGKTTLIKILTGQLKPDKGSAEIMKHDTVSLSGRSLFYFHKDSGLEIDFITPIDAEVTLVEVKAINGNAKSANTVLKNKDQYGVNRCINRREPPDFDTYIGTRLFSEIISANSHLSG